MEDAGPAGTELRVSSAMGPPIEGEVVRGRHRVQRESGKVGGRVRDRLRLRLGFGIGIGIGIGFGFGFGLGFGLGFGIGFGIGSSSVLSFRVGGFAGAGNEPTNPKGKNLMNFECLEAGYQLIADLKVALSRIRQADNKLYVQLRTASASIVLNIAEGRGRVGKDRVHHWRIAHGSAEETVAILRVAHGFGDLSGRDTRAPLQTLDRILPMLWRMTHP